MILLKNTENAKKIGENAKREDIEILKKRKETYLKISKILQNKQKLNAAMLVATQAQFIREAIESYQKKQSKENL